MSGHNKWSKIRHKKALNDSSKGKIYSKYAMLISNAVRELGVGDPDSNVALRLLIQKAKSDAMPQVNIQRAIDRGLGKGKDSEGSLDTLLFEGFGPLNTVFIIEAITDNRNRTVADLKKVVSDAGGSIASQGSTSWNFERKGVIILEMKRIIPSKQFGKEDDIVVISNDSLFEEVAILQGVLDIVFDNDEALVYTTVNDFISVRDSIVNSGIIVVDAELQFVPKERKVLSEQDIVVIESFVDAVSDYQDVKSVWIDI